MREVVRTHEQQYHFMHFRWDGASGAWIETFGETRRRHEAMAALLAELPVFTDPMPTASQVQEGIAHYSSNEEYVGEMWDAVRAMHSRLDALLH